MSIDSRFYVDRGTFTLDVDVNIPSRGITSLFGPSGCGKTTLLRAIAGLERHRDGFLTVDGTTWQNTGIFVPPHKRPLGYVFQEASLFPHLTVRKNIEYGFNRVQQTRRKISLNHAIELLGLGLMLERKPDSLSGGERQRVAIARALAVSPELLLMDEPLAALDLENKQDILPYLESFRDELDIPVIYVSHILEEITRLADHLILIKQGSIVASGDINDMLSHMNLPLAHGYDATVVIDAVVFGHDEQYHLTYLDFSGGRFTVTQKNLLQGSHIRLRLAARDVSLTLERPSNKKTSILNSFRVIIDQITEEKNGLVTLRLLAGETPILSRITHKSSVKLNLKPGISVYAQVKNVVLLS